MVTGLGGIGKTSVICEALRSWLKQEAPPIENILWARIESSHERAELEPQQQAEQALERVLWQLGSQLELPIAALPTNLRRLEAIAGHLLRYWQRFVIVFDHVKSPADVELVLTVAEPLLPLAQVVVTSRCDIKHDQVQLLRLGELNEAESKELLHREATRHSITLTQDAATQIYQQVGGHPLALKLVIWQVSRMPIISVLSALHQESPLAEELYSQTYAPSWQHLSDLSRSALIRLIRLPIAGVSWEELHSITEICNDADLSRVVNQLTSLNLLQVSISPMQEYTYFLHRLTYRFLEYQMRMAAEEGLAVVRR